MRTQLIRGTLLAVGVSIISTLWVESYGFAISHSAGLMVVALLIAPGTLVAFFDLDASEVLMVAVSFLITLGYYLALFLLAGKINSKGEAQSQRTPGAG